MGYFFNPDAKPIFLKDKGNHSKTDLLKRKKTKRKMQKNSRKINYKRNKK